MTQCGPTRDAARGELWLFSYGTLKQRQVQRALFGRALISSPDVLPGFVVTTVAITEPEVVALSGSSEHPMLYWSGNGTDEVRGLALAVTEHNLVQADAYESTDYVRTTATLRSGRVAFVYVARHARLCSRPRATYRPARP